MASMEELIEQYETDEALRKEVDAILADGKITPGEFLSFARRHHVNVTLADLPRITAEARKQGLIK